MSEGFSIEIPPELLEQVVELVVARVLNEQAGCEGGRAWPEWMSVETAAAYLDGSPERLRKLQARRRVPYYQDAPGCRVLFRRSELDAWMSSSRQPARRPSG